ncbi:MAG: hypothetical protein FWE95_03380 [Planctomycetaceae bacterium]|nr:hypothetical protein [Planctomycetaceae bacterium]
MYVPEGLIDSSLITLPSLKVPRQEIEHWLTLVEQRSEELVRTQPHLSRIVLNAKLEGRQLTSGQGVFTLHPLSDEIDSIPLEPLTLAVNSLRWSDDTDAILFSEPDGGNRLLIPAATDSHSYDQLQFRWSLQSRRDTRNGIVFDLALPPCLSIELQLALPDSMILTSTGGLVLPAEKEGNIESGLRTWRVLLGHHSNTTLTIAPDRTSPSVWQKPMIRQETNYHARQEGLEARVRVFFDNFTPRPAELLLELEMPLRPTVIQYGNRPVVWSKTPISPEVTEVRIDLSPFADEDADVLEILSLGPLRENQRWVLPRVRVTSPDVFWTGTRASVRTYPPLRTRNLICPLGIQVTPRSNFDWASEELFVFQFFQDDAQIEFEVVYSIPHVTVNSATQIRWSDNEIQGTVYLDCSVTEGVRDTLNFSISEHWIIDSVTSSSSTGTIPGEVFFIASRDGGDAQTQTLSVQLNRPLVPRQPVSLQLSCRYTNSAQTQFQLAELSPLALSHRHGESHLIATQFDLRARQVRSDPDASASNVPRTFAVDGNWEMLMGNVYPLDSQTQDIRFELEQMRPNYTAAISGSIDIDNNALIPTFNFRCTPVDSSVSRVFVHFTSTGAETATVDWEWLPGESNLSRSFRAYKSSLDELRELLSTSEQQFLAEDLDRGEIWEIRFDELLTVPFAFSARSLIPLGDSIAVPLASVPVASSQRGELTIESTQQLDYRIVGARLDSIPIAPAAWDRYPNTFAAFRYDPQEEPRRSQLSPLMLQRLTPDERFDSAWVWSLRLDVQHNPEGIVRNRALFLVENQGKNSMQITLPSGIEADDVFAVWRDSQQIPWQFTEDRKTIDVALPAGQRFVAIALEYAYQDLSLVQQRKLRPRYPTTDIPILSGSWTSWFPPEFDVSLRYAANNTTAQSTDLIPLSKALDYLLSGTYRAFLGSMWDEVLYSEQRRSDAETAAQYFFAEVASTMQNQSSTTRSATTWGDLLGNERILSAVRTRLASDNTRRTVDTRFLIDKQALAFLGITPATPIDVTSTVREDNVRTKLFENTGLVLLVATRTRTDGFKEYVFALTTPATLSLNRQFHSLSAGHCVLAVPFEVFDSVSPSSQWVPVPRWLSETTLSSIPWSISTQMMQRTAYTADWNAYELPITTEQPLYIVHRQKFAALQWIAFLSVVLLTCRKPFSSPIVLLALLVIFELIARSVAPCYIGIPSGAFLGVLVSLAFVLIRSQVSPNEPAPEHPARHDSTECSASFVQTPLLVRSVLLFGLLSVFASQCVFVSAQTLPERILDAPRKEPYPIVYPTDAEGQIVGETIWVPREFYKLLYDNVRSLALETLPQWNITKAAYQGSLIRGSSGLLECSDDFKAVYDIYLDSSSATITLPELPAVQGKFFWNARPIQPIWNDDAPNNTLSFVIENETPGRHTLEIGLSPKAALHSDGETSHITFAIPKVPVSTLRLNVPLDIPPVSVPDALGAVTANTSLSSVVIAELGPTQQLSLAWVDDPHRSATTVSEVDQYFRLRIKPLQIELETLFRFRVEGGSIRHLTILTDPRWNRRGQFRCDEHLVIPRSETSSDTQSFEGLSVVPYGVSFPSPVSGTVTLRADFVLQGVQGEYYGARNLRLPEFSAFNSRITRSMLAVYADHPLLELTLPIEGRSSGFEAGWLGSSLVVPSDTPDAEYDLNRTESDWALNIRTKKVNPDVAISQFVQFDGRESRCQIVGNFTAASDVFQQCFTADRPIQIETLEVKDSQSVVVESRWQRIAPETMPEQYLVFFRHPVTGPTITIRGYFETYSREELSLQPIPMVTFDETQTTEHSLNLFRTQAVIAELSSPEQSGWAKANVLPPVPEWFAPSIPLGTWQKIEATEAEETNAVQFAPLQFTLSPNRPKVKCKTVLSLHVDNDDQWTMTLEHTGNVTDGELRSLRFRWDERCGAIQPIEPAASWSFESAGGEQTLVVSFDEPIRGEHHVNITVSLNTTGTAALPNVFPLQAESEQFESELFVDLPRRQNNVIIPWDLSYLVETEEQATDAQRLRLQSIDNNFAATINRDEARLTAIFYDIGFLIRKDGSIFGTVTVDLRNRGQEYFVLQMPEGYEPIQISSAGLLLGRTRLEEGNRWRVNIGASNYPQRLSVLFRASLPQSLKQWNRKQIISSLQFPILEGIVVQETIWTIAFEGNLPPMKVASIHDRHSFGSEESDLGEHEPISGIEVALSVIGVNYIRQHNLNEVLKSLPVSTRQEEMQRWFMHWSEEWNIVADKVDFQISHLPVAGHNVRPKLIARSVVSTSDRTEHSGIVRLFSEMMGTRTQESLRVTMEQTVLEKFASTMDSVPKRPVPILNSQVYWQGRMSEDSQCLFGTEEGTLRAIRLTSVPNTGGWMSYLSEHFWLWISLTLVIPIFVLLSVRWVHPTELWLQFPHFWGMTLGILLWVFVPESFIGPIVIVLTFIALFRPSWARHRFRMYS